MAIQLYGIPCMLLLIRARPAATLTFKDVLPMNATKAGEEAYRWNDHLDDGFSSDNLLIKRDGNCGNGSHPCQYSAKLSSVQDCPVGRARLVWQKDPNKSHAIRL